MSGNSDFVIENGVLVKYNGPRGASLGYQAGAGAGVNLIIRITDRRKKL